MSEIQLLKSNTINHLFNSVPENLDRYRSGSFGDLLHDSSLFIKSSFQLAEEKSMDVKCTESDFNEVGCCLALADSLVGVTPYLARDERLWTRLCHFEFLEYARARWKIPQDDHKAIKHIRTHFFARGARGIERDNAISRLWWMVAVCSKVRTLSLESSLKSFLYQSDVRANIIERPSTAQNPNILSEIISKLHQSYMDDKSLFEREKFRKLMKKINIEGGTRLLEVVDNSDISILIDNSIEKS
jgi:hypothetical protein